MQQHANASRCHIGTRCASVLLGILLIGVLLSGCGGSSTTFTIEAEHACDDSRYITMTNLRPISTSLKDWTVENENATYALPDIVLAPGESINVWSGTGTDDAHNIYIGRPGATWDLTNALLYVKGPPSLFGNMEMHFLGCQVDIAP